MAENRSTAGLYHQSCKTVTYIKSNCNFFLLHFLISDAHKKIKAAFEAFDYQSNNTVDVRSVSVSLPSASTIFNIVTPLKTEYWSLYLIMYSRKSEVAISDLFQRD